MWTTNYPIRDLDQHGNGRILPGPVVKDDDIWSAVWALREDGVTLPLMSDIALVKGADGLTVYVASVSDGHWYASMLEVK